MYQVNQSKDPSWDLVVSSKRDLFDFRIKEVWRYRDLLALLIRRDFVAFYKQTIFGPLWFFIQPIFTTVIYVFIFGKLAGISTDGIPMPLFYLVGITAWTYFSDCLIKTSTVFVDNAHIFGKVYFPRLVMPLSIVISNLVRLGVQFVLLALAMLYYGIQGVELGTSWYVLLIPFLVFLMAAQGLGLGIIVSSLTTKYRDLALLLKFGVQLLMYLTTVVYPLSSLNGTIKTIVAANPLTPLIEGMRLGLLGEGSFTFSDLAYVSGLTAFILLIGIVVFNRVERSFVDTI
jgi:lipopolysaccharide transport system permease protein